MDYRFNRRGLLLQLRANRWAGGGVSQRSNTMTKPFFISLMLVICCFSIGAKSNYYTSKAIPDISGEWQYRGSPSGFPMSSEYRSFIFSQDSFQSIESSFFGECFADTCNTGKSSYAYGSYDQTGDTIIFSGVIIDTLKFWIPASNKWYDSISPQRSFSRKDLFSLRNDTLQIIACSGPSNSQPAYLYVKALSSVKSASPYKFASGFRGKKSQVFLKGKPGGFMLNGRKMTGKFLKKGINSFCIIK
jgi:hypothetical protein